MSKETLARRLKVLIVGVGGQGALTAARFLGQAAMEAKLDVMVSQLHGMSQRGGSVECAVLFGSGESAFVGEGEADILVALEPLEALRARPRMNSKTWLVFSRGGIVPSTLSSQGKSYPALEQIIGQLQEVTSTVIDVNGPDLAEQAGAPRALNVVMLGALAGLGRMPLKAEQLVASITSSSPERFREINRRAFDLGLQVTQKALEN